MSVLGQIRSGLDLAWSALGDAKVSVQYVKIARGSYNPATGAVAQTKTVTTLDVGLVDYSDGIRRNDDVQSGDRRALIRAKDLAGKPGDGDLLVEADGTTWSVVKVSGDSRIYWDLQVRI